MSLRKSLLILFVLPLTINMSAFAQETPTPEPTATELPTLTPLPTDTPTLTLAPSWTPLPSDTPTLTLPPSLTPTSDATATTSETPAETASPSATASETATMTETATETATGTATETPTITPTATLEPELPLQVIYAESFRGGPNPFIQLTGAPARLLRQGAEIVMRVIAPENPMRVTGASYADVALGARFAVNSGTIRLEVRQTDQGSYALQLGMDGQVLLLRNNVLLANAVVPPSAPGQWRALRLSAVGASLRVSVDGVEVIGISDAEPLSGGAVRFLAIGADAGGLLVDDILLSSVPLELQAQAGARTLEGGEMSAMSARDIPTYTLSPNDAVYVMDYAPYNPDPVWQPNYQIHRITNVETRFIANGASPAASADGRRLMFSCDLGLGYQVCISDSLGGNARLLPVAPEHADNFNYVGGFSPDGTWALYTTETETQVEAWIIHLATSITVQIGSNANPQSGQSNWGWGPDGAIYYANAGQALLRRYSFDLTDPTNISVTDITLSPYLDSTRSYIYRFSSDVAIAFDGTILLEAYSHPLCGIDGGCEVVGFSLAVLYPSSGGNGISGVPLPPENFAVDLQWLPDSLTTAAYVYTGVEVIDTQSGLTSQLSTSGLRAIGELSWSIQPADATSDCSGVSERFVFVSDNTPTQANELRDADNAACNTMQFTAPAYAPDYSFVNDQLAFVNGTGTFTRDLMVADGAGGNVQPLGLTGNTNNPTWSPDGSLIAFDYSPSPGAWRFVHVVEPNGGNLRQVNTNVGSMPTWSGNGYWIAYINSSGDLSVVNADCDSVTCYDSLLYGAPGRLSAPAWSPDGRTIVVVEQPSAGQPNYRLLHLTMNASGERGADMFAAGYPAVTSSAVGYTDPHHLGYPAWATDGQALLIETKESRFAPTQIERLVRTGVTSWALDDGAAMAARFGGGSDIFGRQPVVMQVAPEVTCPAEIKLSDPTRPIQLREGPSSSAPSLRSLQDGLQVTMIGVNLTGNWALIEVDGQRGWAIKDGVLISNCVTYDIRGDDGQPLTSAAYDFVLDPIPASFADTPCRESVPESEGAAAFELNLRNCSRVVLYYFATKFRTDVDSEPEIRMSDILSAVYAGELSTLSAASGVVGTGLRTYSGIAASEIGREALINNFWVVAYELERPCLEDPNCDFRLSPEEIADSYLYQVQSWYQEAIRFRSDAQGKMLDDYYRASRLQRGLAFQALSTEAKDRDITGRVWQWGNFGFGDNAGIYPTAQDNPSVMYCYTVRQFAGDPSDGVAYVLRTEFWNDYKFVIITTRSIGQTSTFDIRGGANRPGWIDAIIIASIDGRVAEPIRYPLYIQSEGGTLYVPCDISSNAPYSN